MCQGTAKPKDVVVAGADTDAAASKSSSPKSREITRAEVQAHNSPSSAWTIVHGSVLDVTGFAARHPGGDLILLSAGRDATVLFETYHPRGVPQTIVDKLTVGKIPREGGDGGDDSFYSWDSTFYDVLKKRVVRRLESRGLDRRGGMEIWIKAVFLLVGFWFSLLKMYVSFSLGEAALWSVLMGTFAAFVGTCIQHDGNHGAFASSRTLNKMAGWTLDMIGASAFTWEMQHMLGHHPYTNLLDVEEDGKKERGVDCPVREKDQESDPDVFSSFPLMRMHPHHPVAWYHRYQHLYAPILFAFMTLAKVLQQDVEVAASGRLYHIDATCRYGSVWNKVRFWVMKVVSMAYMMGLPVYFHGVAGGIGLFVVGHLTCGELLATMFIVNHVIEGVSFAKKNEPKLDAAMKAAQESDGDGVSNSERSNRPTTVHGSTPMETTRAKAAATARATKPIPHVPYNDWAAVQCQTSVNWSPGSWFWNHFSGGLSHQIEHHLFPSICHTNYVHIQDVVEDTCRGFGVPYQAEPSLWAAYGKMLSHLRFMGCEKKE